MTEENQLSVGTVESSRQLMTEENQLTVGRIKQENQLTVGRTKQDNQLTVEITKQVANDRGKSADCWQNKVS